MVFVLILQFIARVVCQVECLMYTFHTICKQADKFLTEDADRLKDFRIRLQFLARYSQL